MAKSRSYRVSLSPVERKKIQHAKRKANSDNRKVRYAIILAADEKRYGHALTYEKIAAKAGASIPTVVDTLKKFCTGGLAKAVKTPRIRYPVNSNARSSRFQGSMQKQLRQKYVYIIIFTKHSSDREPNCLC